ncbi:MAG: hypothetical protein H5T97_02570 [Firmicutes bacterium]|nr:hypothetical protein [Bacillota bacterium]
MSLYADGSGRVVSARIEHVDLEVRHPEVIMEVDVVAEVEPEEAQVSPERGWDAAAPGETTAPVGHVATDGTDGPPALAEAAATGFEERAGDDPIPEGTVPGADPCGEPPEEPAPSGEEGEQGRAAGAGEGRPRGPRPLQELLWEGVREVRELDAEAARYSIICFAGRNIVIGGP